MKTKSAIRGRRRKKVLEKDIAATYNEFKEFEGQQYTGMKVGRSHKWHYDEGVWKETKITPDLWRIEYGVNKRRVGKAPEGSGVPVGTQYHWYIGAHQNVTKLDANTYTTSMTGLKFKLAHMRSDKGKWNISEATQRKHLVKFLKEMIAELEKPRELKEKADSQPIKRKKAVEEIQTLRGAPKTRRKSLSVA